jgi:hypothetical protein
MPPKATNNYLKRLAASTPSPIKHFLLPLPRKRKILMLFNNCVNCKNARNFSKV